MLGALLLPVACTSGDFRSGPPPPTTTTTLAPEVTIRGVVAVYSASARIVTLSPAVSGITNVLVATDTVVVRSSGAPAAVTDLVARASIDITGRPSGPDSFAARRIVLL